MPLALAVMQVIARPDVRPGNVVPEDKRGKNRFRFRQRQEKRKRDV